MTRTLLVAALLLSLIPPRARAQAEPAEPGRLRIRCAPGAALHLDDKPLGVAGETALRVDDVAPGDHVLRATKDGFHPLRRTIRVRPGRTTRVTLGHFVPRHRLTAADVDNDAVSDAARAAPAPVAGGTLRVQVKGLPQTLSRWWQRPPHANVGYEILDYLFAPLIRIDPDTMEALPWLARWWTSQDVVDLAPEAKDGEPSARHGWIESVEVGKQVVLWVGAREVTVGRHDITVDKQVDGLTLAGGGARFSVAEKPTEVGRYTLRFVDRTGARREVIPWARIASGSWTLGGRPQPGVRRRCRLELHLRDGLTWDDGKPLTARDVGFTVERLLRGPEKMGRGPGQIAGTKVLDKLTVRLDWRRPHFRALAVVGGMPLTPRHIYDVDGDQRAFYQALAQNPANNTPVGCGPFKFVKRSPTTIELARNEAFFARALKLPYCDPRQPFLAGLTFVAIPGPEAALKAIAAGKVDVLKGFEPRLWAHDLTTADGFGERVVKTRALQPVYTYIGWNLRKPQFQSAQLRRALGMLLPRDQIARAVHHDMAFPVSGPFFHNSPAYDRDIPPLASDTRQARALLDKAGVTDRDGDGWRDIPGSDPPRRFEIEYTIHDARDYHAEIAQFVAEAFQGARIKVRVRKVAWRSFGATVAQRRFDAIRFANRAAFDPDPFATWHSSQASGAGQNWVGYENPELDRLIEQAQVTFDDAKRWSLLRQVHRMLHKDQPYTFMFCFYTLAMVRKDLRGVKLYPLRRDATDYAEWWRVAAPAKAPGVGG